MILLTGGLSCIGSYPAVRLVKAGYNVINTDNFSNRRPSVISCVEKTTGKTVQLDPADVSDKHSLGKIFECSSIKAVIHFAGYKSVGESAEPPARYYRNNLGDTFSLLEVMQEYRVKCLIFSPSL